MKITEKKCLILILCILLFSITIISNCDSDIGKNNLLAVGNNIFEIPTGDWHFTAWEEKKFSPETPHKSKNWGKCFVPGLWFEAKDIPKEWLSKNGDKWFENINYAWYMIKFNIPKEYEGFDSEIRFGGVKWSAEVWLNGIKLGNHSGGYAPFELATGDVLKVGKENILLVKVGGWNTVPKNEKNSPQITIGNCENGGNKSGGITEPVSIHFYKKLKIKRLQIQPDINQHGIKVGFHVELPASFRKSIMVEFYVNKTETGEEIKKFTLPAISFERKQINDLMFFLPLKECQEWLPENPQIYNLKLHVYSDDDERGLEDISESNFGLRQISVKDNMIFLNGKRVKLFGMNLGSEASYSYGSDLVWNRNKSVYYLVKLSKFMGINLFKTNYEPLNRHWIDICDRNGIMLIVEFPACSKSSDKNDKNLLEHRLIEYSAMMSTLWNHPSIVGYSIDGSEYLNPFSENEETKPDINEKIILPFIKYQDSQRFIMITDKVSGDVCDIQTDIGIDEGSAFDFEKLISDFVENNSNKLLSISNFLSKRNSDYKILEIKNLQDISTSYAEALDERVRIIREYPFQIIIPGYFAETVQLEKWCYELEPKTNLKEYITSIFHVYKNALSPISINLKFPYKQFNIKDKVKVPLTLINDSPSTFTFGGEIFFTNTNPYFIAFNAAMSARLCEPAPFNKKVLPYSSIILDCNIEMPDISDIYSICAISKYQKLEYILNQNTIYVFPAMSAKPLEGKTFFISMKADDEQGSNLKTLLNAQFVKLGAVNSAFDQSDIIFYIFSEDENINDEKQHIEEMLQKGRTVIITNPKNNFDISNYHFEIEKSKWMIDTVHLEEKFVSPDFNLKPQLFVFTNNSGVSNNKITVYPDDFDLLFYGLQDFSEEKIVLGIIKKFEKGRLVINTLNWAAGKIPESNLIIPSLEALLLAAVYNK